MAKRKTPHRAPKRTLDEVRLELPRVNSAMLSSLRDLVAATTSLNDLIGPIAQFRVVVDANRGLTRLGGWRLAMWVRQWK